MRSQKDCYEDKIFDTFTKSEQQFPTGVIKNQKFLSSLVFYVKNSKLEIKKHPCYFCLSLFSVLIVVLATCVVQTIIDSTPIIFLKQAESESAQIDISISPNGADQNDFESQSAITFQSLMNYTRAQQILNELNQIASPRADYLLGIRSSKNPIFNCTFLSNYTTMAQHLANLTALDSIKNCLGAQIHLKMFDTQKEKDMGVGRDYKEDEIPQGQCMIHQLLAQRLNVSEGDFIYAQFWIKNILVQVGQTMNLENYFRNQAKYKSYDDAQVANLTELQWVIFRVPIQVKKIFFDSFGKFEDGSLDSSILMEYKYFFSHISNFAFFPQSIQKERNMPFLQYLSTKDPYEYTDSIIMNLENRLTVYLQSNYDNIQMDVTRRATQITLKLGIFPFQMALPTLQSLEPLKFGSMFLGIILNMIIMILALLSIILLYSLLLVTIETKSFELGVIRLLGLNKIGIISLIFFQALSFVLPGIFLGLILSFPALLITSQILKSQIGAKISSSPTLQAILQSVGIGVLIPIFASYYPIKEALQQSLSGALDVTRSKTQSVKIQVITEGKQFPWTRISFSLISSLFGISIYYLLPLSLLSQNISLLMLIFFWILIGLLFGFVLLSLNIQHLMERLVIFAAFLACKVPFLLYALVNKMLHPELPLKTARALSAGLKKLIRKNLAAHRIRNRRTAIMYSISLAFVIFLIVSYDMQIRAGTYAQQQSHGVYLEISHKDQMYSLIDVQMFEEFISEELGDDVESHSWMTRDLQDVAQDNGVKNVYLTHIGQLYQTSPIITGVSANFQATTFNNFLDISERSNSSFTVFEELYTARGSQSMLAGKAFQNYLQMSLDPSQSYFLVFWNGTYTQKFELRCSAFLNQAPALRFSKLPRVTDQSTVVSFPTYLRILKKINATVQSVSDIPMQRLLLRLRGGDDYDAEVSTRVAQKIDAFLTAKGLDNLEVWDYRNYQEGIKTSQNVIFIIFTIVILLTMFLCFFSLTSSMSANIIEQSKEIAILRSLGLTRALMIFIYVSEAFVLVFSSSFMGLVIGSVIGFTMTMQRALFTQLPIKFVFPYLQFIQIFIISICVAFFSSFLPAQRIMKKQISDIIKITGG